MYGNRLSVGVARRSGTELGSRGLSRIKGVTGKKKSSAVKKKQPAAKAQPRNRPSIKVLHAARLRSIPWLVHGFSTRAGGVSEAYGGGQLNLGATAEDSAENVERNRTRLLAKLKARDAQGQPWPLVALNQIHSAAIYRVYGARGTTGVGLHIGPEGGEEVAAAGDGLITSSPGVLLGVKTADCVPVILADRTRRAVGIFHAGWRGTVQRIVQKGVGEMRRQLHCQPRDLVAAIGPGIGVCCYEIGEEVEAEFESQFAYASELFEEVFDSRSLHLKYPMLFLNQRAPGHGEPAMSHHLDLAKANLLQLAEAGVPVENIEPLKLCTSCRSDLFFSYRRERVTGRMLAVVGIR
jgi:YfiH family protein